MADAERLNFLPPTRAAMVSSEWRQVVIANPHRQAVLITNTSDATICLAFGGRPAVGTTVPAGSERGVALVANGGALNILNPLLTTQAIYGRHGGTGEKNLAIQEAEGVR